MTGPQSDMAVRPKISGCCAAVGGLVSGLVRPRPADQRFLDGLVDAGLPTPRRTVRLTTLPRSPRMVPTSGVVEAMFRPRRVANVLTSFVVSHPEATFVVDPGVCLDVERRAVAQLPMVLRVAVRPSNSTVPTITALGPRAADLDFALPTHAHWDHVCGLLDLPGLPVRMHRVEHDWVARGAVAPVAGVRDSLRDRRIDGYDLDGPAVSTFASSHDLFGDGTVLVVDLAGHTPGSVGVLLHTDDGWVLLAGDAVWHSLQIDTVRQKAGYPGIFADHDRDAAFLAVHRLHAARHLMRVIASHDHDAIGQFETETGALDRPDGQGI